MCMINCKWTAVGTRVLLAFVFVSSQTASAGQNPSTPDASDSASKATPQSADEKKPAVAANVKAQPAESSRDSEESSLPEQSSSRNGKHESIKVHGHWTIDVRNRDGSLARHVEFENSLAPDNSWEDSAGVTHQVPGGATYLNSLLIGELLGPTPANWQIWLGGPAGLLALSSTAAPCTGQPSQQFATCIIAPVVGPAGGLLDSSGIQLNGGVTATQNGQITVVATMITGLACGPAAVKLCPSLLENAGITIANLTASSNFPGAPINVSAGQTVAVTVNISFS